MPTQVQWRRGTTTQHDSFTGAAGEVTIDTTLDTLRVHDGSTAGGIRIAKYSELNSSFEKIKSKKIFFKESKLYLRHPIKYKILNIIQNNDIGNIIFKRNFKFCEKIC